MKDRIVIFGGTFNPVTRVHLDIRLILILIIQITNIFLI